VAKIRRPLCNQGTPRTPVPHLNFDFMFFAGTTVSAFGGILLPRERLCHLLVEYIPAKTKTAICTMNGTGKIHPKYYVE
jgi:hypothetical protein